MEPTVTEIAPDIFRISIMPPGSPVNFGCFLVRDDEPVMVETGMQSLFEPTLAAVKSLVDPAKLRHFIIPHFEMDECGSLNRFAAVAPDAKAVTTSVGSLVALPDFTQVPLHPVRQGDTLTTGRKTLHFIPTPWVHYWDSMLVYDETDRLLFTSDLFMQGGDGKPTDPSDRTADVVGFAMFSGLLPSQKHLERALDRIEPLAVDTLACHHGSVLQGDPTRYYQALRNSVVGDVLDAPFYNLDPSQLAAM